MKEATTFDNNSNPLTIEDDGVSIPAGYDFKTVNDFVHRVDVSFEDLQGLCLALASELNNFEALK